MLSDSVAYRNKFYRTCRDETLTLSLLFAKYFKALLTSLDMGCWTVQRVTANLNSFHIVISIWIIFLKPQSRFEQNRLLKHPQLRKCRWICSTITDGYQKNFPKQSLAADLSVDLPRRTKVPMQTKAPCLSLSRGTVTSINSAYIWVTASNICGQFDELFVSLS